MNMYANGPLKRQQQIDRINTTYGKNVFEKGGVGSGKYQHKKKLSSEEYNKIRNTEHAKNFEWNKDEGLYHRKEDVSNNDEKGKVISELAKFKEAAETSIRAHENEKDEKKDEIKFGVGDKVVVEGRDGTGIIVTQPTEQYSVDFGNGNVYGIMPHRIKKFEGDAKPKTKTDGAGNNLHVPVGHYKIYHEYAEGTPISTLAARYELKEADIRKIVKEYR